MTTIPISFPESMMEFMDAQVASKGYVDVSEYVRYLVREAQEREADARLEALLLEGLASGDPIPGDDDYWKGLRERTEAIAEEYAAEKAKP